MRDQKPAGKRLRRSRRLPLSGFGFCIFCVLVSNLVFPGATAHAESGSAVIVGVERLYVRRGPGAEFPPFATLTKGDTVEVQEMQGEWARILTGGGQTGYVRSTFLVLPGEHKKAPVPAPPSPVAKPLATTKPLPAPPVAAEPAPLRAANARNKALEAENRNLQLEILRLRSRWRMAPGPAAPGPVALASETPGAVTPASEAPASEAPASVTPASVTPASEAPASEAPASETPASVTPAPTLILPPAADTDPARGEIARLTALVETLQRRLDVRPPIEGLPAPAVPSDGTSHPLSSGLTLGIIGLAIGWLFGSTLGRKPDRGRRPRIRF